MSRGITKPQFALAVAKGKLLELKALRVHMDIADIPHDNSMSGAARVRTVVEKRIKEVQYEIDSIEGNLPTYTENQRKGLIS